MGPEGGGGREGGWGREGEGGGGGGRRGTIKRIGGTKELHVLTRLSFIAIVALLDNKTFAADLLPW